MLVAGADVSGTPERGFGSYISLIVGDAMSARRLRKRIPVEKLHMSALPRYKQQRVIRALDFSGGSLMALCFHVERESTVRSVFESPRLIKKPGRKARVYSEFDSAFLALFQDRLQTFCAQNGTEMPGLRVECDFDMAFSVRRWNMVPKSPGIAHELADAVSWCNLHRERISGCVEMDLAGQIYGRLATRMTR